MDDEVEVVTTEWAGLLSFETACVNAHGLPLRWAMRLEDDGLYYLDSPFGVYEIDDAIRYVATGLVEP